MVDSRSTAGKASQGRAEFQKERWKEILPQVLNSTTSSGSGTTRGIGLDEWVQRQGQKGKGARAKDRREQESKIQKGQKAKEERAN